MVTVTEYSRAITYLATLLGYAYWLLGTWSPLQVTGYLLRQLGYRVLGYAYWLLGTWLGPPVTRLLGQRVLCPHAWLRILDN